MKTFAKSALICANCRVTVDWDTATAILKDRIHIL